MTRSRVSNSRRVLYWNSIFHQARAEAVRLKARATQPEFKLKGGRLADEKQSVLTVLVLSALAIEARANHLIVELAESQKISFE